MRKRQKLAKKKVKGTFKRFIVLQRLGRFVPSKLGEGHTKGGLIGVVTSLDAAYVEREVKTRYRDLAGTVLILEVQANYTGEDKWYDLLVVRKFSIPYVSSQGKEQESCHGLVH